MSINYSSDYTQQIESIINGISDEGDYSPEAIKSFLKGSLRPFGERLLNFYNHHAGTEYDAAEAGKDLVKRGKDAGISFNRNTALNWFSGKTSPKYGDNDRENMLKIVFALQMDCAEAEDFFNKVYLDRAFNPRDSREFIYLYCIAKEKTYSEALSIVASLEGATGKKLEVHQDETVFTYQLSDFIWDTEDDGKIVEFIASRPHNFSMSNTMAKGEIARILQELKGDNDHPGLAETEAQNYDHDVGEDSILYGRNTKSLDFVLYMIFDHEPTGKTATDIISRDFRYEISNQFPDKQSLSQIDSSSYILRKELVLLNFYRYWVLSDLHNGIGSYNGFCEEMNDILDKCGYSLLYPGNPYDALFLCCSSYKEEGINPLDVFRDIINSNNDE